MTTRLIDGFEQERFLKSEVESPDRGEISTGLSKAWMDGFSNVLGYPTELESKLTLARSVPCQLVRLRIEPSRDLPKANIDIKLLLVLDDKVVNLMKKVYVRWSLSRRGAPVVLLQSLRTPVSEVRETGGRKGT